MELKNNTVLITGGSSGIGLEFASELLALGNTVIITGRNQAKLDQAKARLPQINLFKSDVSKPEEIAELYDEVTRKFPKLNLLINNAGEMRVIVLKNTPADLFDLTREIDTNLRAPIQMVQQFLPHLLKQPSAAILNVTSGLAFVPFPISPIYSASKAGLRAYTRALRIQLKETKVKVFELAAPAADTQLSTNFLNVDGFDAKAMIKTSKLIGAAMKGIESDQYDILPGLAKVIKVMSRLAPGFMLKQMSKIGAKLMFGG